MKKQTGFSLIELMVSMLLGIVIVTATIAIYIGTVKGSSDTIKSARLNHDLEMALSLMMNDLRRAGYWGDAITGSDAKDNPFTAAATNLNIPVSSCVLYTYDGVDEDGVVDADEYYGFKLDGTSIRMRMSGTTTNSVDCTDGSWGTGEIIDDSEVEITKLEFRLSPIAAVAGPPATPALTESSKCFNDTKQTFYYTPCSSVTAVNLPVGDDAIETRQINIILTGRLVDDNTVIKTLTGTVKVRNDRVFTQ